MENFIIYNPVRLHFGKGVVNTLGETVSQYGQKALLVYGKASLKSNGVYQDIMQQLNMFNIEVYEYSGIKSNPVISDVDAAAGLGRKNNVDVIIAAGGGSVIDSAKIISLAIPQKKPAWDLITSQTKAVSAVPLIAVLTLAATGTEMNPFAVVQNNDTAEKPGFYSPLIFPCHSFLDPSYTMSVPANYTAYGIADLIAHALEGYFGQGDTSLTDKFIFGIIREATEFGPLLIQNLNNYKYREKIMFAALCALNGTTAYGKKSGDWGVHGIGHSLSVLYDIPHGATLSIVYPAWLKHFEEKAAPSVLLLGREVFGTDGYSETIAALENLFNALGAPVRMSQIGLDRDTKEDILKNIQKNRINGYHYKLNHSDLSHILELMY
jgi:alcohol dehydrogenase YqhD (iron-dependent ADH family)